MAEPRRWLKTLFNTYTQSQVLKQWPLWSKFMTARLIVTDRGSIIRFGWSHNLNNSVPLWKPDLRSSVKVAGMHVLLRMHIGSLYTTYHLVFAIIHCSYLSSCRRDFYREYLKHIFLLCNRFSNQWFLIFDDVVSRFKNLQDDDILGEESHVDRNLRVQVTLAWIHTFPSLSLYASDCWKVWPHRSSHEPKAITP